MSELFIGAWVSRDGTKLHRVESVIEDAAITHCGRRMEPVVRGRRLEVWNGPVSRASRPLQELNICESCG